MNCTATRPVSRRQVLLGACSCGFLSAGAALARARGETSRAGTGRAAQTGRFGEVSPGIFVRAGADEETASSNAGAIANAGFVVGAECVAVLDAGGSVADGKRLRDAIRQRTSLPIRYVVLTHAHPDHIFGAAAFTADRPKFVAHARFARSLAARGDYYLRRLESELGRNAGEIVEPTLPVESTLRLDIGGRELTLTAHPIAHSDNDLSVLDARTGTLIAGDLLFVRRVPALDGSLRGWLRELARLKALPATRAVPGHGPAGVDWPAAAAGLERYLTVLLTETRAASARGVEIEAAVKVVGQSERPHWALFDDYHGRNVTQAFKELEWE